MSILQDDSDTSPRPRDCFHNCAEHNLTWIKEFFRLFLYKGLEATLINCEKVVFRETTMIDVIRKIIILVKSRLTSGVDRKKLNIPKKRQPMMIGLVFVRIPSQTVGRIRRM